MAAPPSAVRPSSTHLTPAAELVRLLAAADPQRVPSLQAPERLGA